MFFPSTPAQVTGCVFHANDREEMHRILGLALEWCKKSQSGSSVEKINFYTNPPAPLAWRRKRPESKRFTLTFWVVVYGLYVHDATLTASLEAFCQDHELQSSLLLYSGRDGAMLQFPELPLIYLSLEPKYYDSLVKCGITSIRELCALTCDEVDERLYEHGPRSRRAIYDCLDRLGLRLVNGY